MGGERGLPGRRRKKVGAMRRKYWAGIDLGKAYYKAAVIDDRLALAMVILTLLMVSRIRYPALASILRRRWLSLPGLGVAAVLSIWLSPQLVWLGLIGCYVSFGIVRAAFELLV